MRLGQTIAGSAALIVVLASCTAGPNTAAIEGEAAAGFWLGLWHGLICFITFIVSLFNDQVRMYEVQNNGGWYDFGFILGVMIAFSGPAGGAASSGKRRG